MLQSVQRRIQWSPSIKAMRKPRTDLQIDAELVYPQGNCIPPAQSVAFHRMQFISVDKNHWLWSVFHNLKSYKIAQRQWKMKITLKGILDRHSIWQAGAGGGAHFKIFHSVYWHHNIILSFLKHLPLLLCQPRLLIFLLLCHFLYLSLFDPPLLPIFSICWSAPGLWALSSLFTLSLVASCSPRVSKLQSMGQIWPATCFYK